MDWLMMSLVFVIGFGLGVMCGCWLCGGIIEADPSDVEDTAAHDSRYVYASKKFPMH